MSDDEVDPVAEGAGVVIVAAVVDGVEVGGIHAPLGAVVLVVEVTLALRDGEILGVLSCLAAVDSAVDMAALSRLLLF